MFTTWILSGIFGGSGKNRFLVNLGSESYRTGRINDEFIHVVCSGFYAGLFEVVVHDMPREAAEGYIRELRSFYNNGWKEYF